MRTQKFIADAGICSRRQAEELIKSGKVLINGKKAEIGSTIDPEKDVVYASGQRIRPEKRVYLMLNKPRGFISTADDPWGRKQVTHLAHVPQRVFPVGRLDKDTSGLLLLTNDGDWANRIMHPRYEVKKTYVAQLDKPIEPKDLLTINDGIVLDRKKIHAVAKKMSNKRVKITIHTGMNKEVKRIFKTLGYWVRDLKRTHIGDLELDVKEGRTRKLTAAEVVAFDSTNQAK